MKLDAYTSSININYRFIKELNMKGKLSKENIIFMILM